MSNHLVCESTIESAPRRDFIRGAAVATTALAIGGTLLGKNLIPTSRASSNVCGNPCSGCQILVKCNIVSYAEVVVDGYNANNGTLGSGCWYWCSVDGEGCLMGHAHALTFGTPCIVFCKYSVERTGPLSGEGIASARTKSAPNRCGLDFYTNYTKRISVTNAGKVGIGTVTPCSTLCVVGDIKGCSILGGSNSGTGTGITGLTAEGDAILGQSSTTGNGVVGESEHGVGVSGTSSFGSGVTGYSFSATLPAVYGASQTTKVCCCTIVPGSGIGVSGKSGSGIGVCGYSCTGTGVYGKGTIGISGSSSTCNAVWGCSTAAGKAGVYGHGVGFGIGGRSDSTGGVGVHGRAGVGTAIAMVAQGATGQTAPLQEWQNNCGTPLAVINNAGSLGLGGVTNPHHVLCISGKAHASSGFSIGPCVCVNTTLAVNGSFAAKTRTVGSSQTLLTTDYALLATGTITLTLPPAKTQNGMTIFIKNTSTGTITVAPGGSDTIEGATSSSPKTLGKQYDSLQLISNGSNEWFIVGSVKCGAVIS